MIHMIFRIIDKCQNELLIETHKNKVFWLNKQNCFYQTGAPRERQVIGFIMFVPLGYVLFSHTLP